MLRWAMFAVAVAVQLVVLYSPDAGGPPPFPHADKVVHVAVFALVGVTGVLAGIRRVPLAVALVLHGGVSELVQGMALSGRSGSGWDLLADVVGVMAGVLLPALVTSRCVDPRDGCT